MRRKDKEITDSQIVNEILSESNICRLGLHDKEFPYVIPMNYGYKNSCLYFHCAITGKKIDLIKANPHAAFEIEYDSETIKNDVSCRWTTKYRSIMGQGIIEILRQAHEKTEALNVIMQQHGKMNNSYEKSALDKIVVLKLSILSLSAKQSGDWE